jgi:hypothetical protein
MMRPSHYYQAPPTIENILDDIETVAFNGNRAMTEDKLINTFVGEQLCVEHIQEASNHFIRTVKVVFQDQEVLVGQAPNYKIPDPTNLDWIQTLSTYANLLRASKALYPASEFSPLN